MLPTAPTRGRIQSRGRSRGGSGGASGSSRSSRSSTSSGGGSGRRRRRRRRRRRSSSSSSSTGTSTSTGASRSSRSSHGSSGGGGGGGGSTNVQNKVWARLQVVLRQNLSTSKAPVLLKSMMQRLGGAARSVLPTGERPSPVQKGYFLTPRLTRAMRDILGLITLRNKMNSTNNNNNMIVWPVMLLTKMMTLPSSGVSH